MATFGDLATIAFDLLSEYVMVALAVVLIGGYLLIKSIKKNKDRKVQIPVPRPEGTDKEDMVPNKQMEPFKKTATVESDESLSDMFNPDSITSDIPSDNVVDRIKTLSEDIIKQGNSMDDSLRNDFDKLRDELLEVNKQRKEIKKHGLKLSDLYQKYGQREKHLTQMLSNIEDMLRRNRHQK